MKYSWIFIHKLNLNWFFYWDISRTYRISSKHHAWIQLTEITAKQFKDKQVPIALSFDRDTFDIYLDLIHAPFNNFDYFLIFNIVLTSIKSNFFKMLIEKLALKLIIDVYVRELLFMHHLLSCVNRILHSLIMV